VFTGAQQKNAALWGFEKVGKQKNGEYRMMKEKRMLTEERYGHLKKFTTEQ
jgi:hypothetical protein